MLKIGLVVEGAHDYILLEPLLKHELKSRGHESVEFKHLHPFVDATGIVAPGGWSRIKAWCERFSGDEIETFFLPLFDGDPPCDAIIVQVDGDALEHARIMVPPLQISVAERVGAIVSAVEGWLCLQPSRSRQLACAVPVMQTEAWVLAAEGINYESDNAKNEFRKSYSLSSEKMADFYRRRVLSAQAGYCVIRDNCESYGLFQMRVDYLDLPVR